MNKMDKAPPGLNGRVVTSVLDKPCTPYTCPECGSRAKQTRHYEVTNELEPWQRAMNDTLALFSKEERDLVMLNISMRNKDFPSYAQVCAYFKAYAAEFPQACETPEVLYYRWDPRTEQAVLYKDTPRLMLTVGAIVLFVALITLASFPG